MFTSVGFTQKQSKLSPVFVTGCSFIICGKAPAEVRPILPQKLEDRGRCLPFRLHFKEMVPRSLRKKDLPRL